MLNIDSWSESCRRCPVRIRLMVSPVPLIRGSAAAVTAGVINDPTTLISSASCAEDM